MSTEKFNKAFIVGAIKGKTICYLSKMQISVNSKLKVFLLFFAIKV
jgi:hypothetical protein